MPLSVSIIVNNVQSHFFYKIVEASISRRSWCSMSIFYKGSHVMFDISPPYTRSMNAQSESKVRGGNNASCWDVVEDLSILEI